jgi:hypothetical protein
MTLNCILGWYFGSPGLFAGEILRPFLLGFMVIYECDWLLLLNLFVIFFNMGSFCDSILLFHLPPKLLTKREKETNID